VQQAVPQVGEHVEAPGGHLHAITMTAPAAVHIRLIC
jgi:hypothetical protein